MTFALLSDDNCPGRKIGDRINAVSHARKNNKGHLHKELQCKGEISTRALYGCKDVEKYTGYAGNRFPKELMACGHKIPRVMHVIHKFLQAISEIAPPITLLDCGFLSKPRIIFFSNNRIIAPSFDVIYKYTVWR